MMNSWRAIAKFARDRLVAASPGQVQAILEVRTFPFARYKSYPCSLPHQFWTLRLTSLARLRLYNHATAETMALFSAISAIKPPEAQKHVLELIPLDLQLARARVRYWANDHMGYIDA